MFYKPGEGDSSEGRTGSWIIESYKDKDIRMILPPKDSKKYPFGRYYWQIGINLITKHSVRLKMYKQEQI